MKETSQ